MTLDDLWGHTSIPTEKLGVKQKIYRRKRWFGNLWLPYVNFNDLCDHTLWNICIFIMLAFIEILAKSVNKRIC